MKERRDKRIMAGVGWMLLAGLVTLGVAAFMGSQSVNWSENPDVAWSNAAMTAGIVAVALFPFMVAVSYVLRSLVRRRQLGVTLGDRGAMEQDRELHTLSASAVKWLGAAVLTWICTFLAVAGFAIACMRLYPRQSQFAEPTSLSAGSPTYDAMFMMDLARICMAALALAAFIAFAVVMAIGFIRGAKMSVRWQKRAKVLVVVSVCVFAGSMILSIVLGSMETRTARSEVMKFLGAVPAGSEVTIEGRKVADPGPIIAVLLQTASLPAHHSHAKDEFTVVITGAGESLTLKVGQDSAVPDEYWVYMPNFRQWVHIGNVKTNLLAGWPNPMDN